MGGEHDGWCYHHRYPAGSSPRGRGTHTDILVYAFSGRIIPAWAGNTWRRWGLRWGAPDHPRVGGEHPMREPSRHSSYGSSPRGRGTLRVVAPPGGMGRIIPAWAGNTALVSACLCWVPDHPRVGGEHAESYIDARVVFGSSPRGRGTRFFLAATLRRWRIIPAWAGNTWLGFSEAYVYADHPRVGGEHVPMLSIAQCNPGSSPRGRGTPAAWSKTCCVRRIIPAWAGNTCRAGAAGRSGPDHPRVGGEHRRGGVDSRFFGGSSPRGRGTRQPRPRERILPRIIPAWAGNTLPFTSTK